MQFENTATEGVLWKNVFLKVYQKFSGKYLCQSLFVNAVVGLRSDFQKFK